MTQTKEERIKSYPIPRFTPSIGRFAMADVQDALCPLTKGEWTRQNAAKLVAAIEKIPAEGARKLTCGINLEKMRRNALALSELIQIVDDAVIYVQNDLSIIAKALDVERKEYDQVRANMIEEFEYQYRLKQQRERMQNLRENEE